MHTAYVSVRLGLLALLDRADMYGYQLKSQFEAQTGGIWPLNIGQVYTTLERLERDGLVTVAAAPDPAPAGGREQKYYAITAAGREALADWYAASLTDAPPPRDELVAKILFALVGGREHALSVITRQRTALTAQLQARRRALRAQDGDHAGAPGAGRAGRPAAGGTGVEASAPDADRADTGTGTGRSDDLAPHRRPASGALPSGSRTGAGRPTEAGATANGAAAVAAQLVTDALVARAEADLRWLDLCEARVSRLMAEPTEPPGGPGREVAGTAGNGGSST